MKRFLSLVLAVILAAVLAPIGFAAGGNVESFVYGGLNGEWGNGSYTNINGFYMVFDNEVIAVIARDFSEIYLVRDGEKIPVTIGKEIRRDVYTYENGQKQTSFNIPLDRAYTEPGSYKLHAVYQGVPLQIYSAYIEGPLSDTPADPEALNNVGCWYSWFENRYNVPLATAIDWVYFIFDGKQDAFSMEDLTGLRITRSGEEVSLSFLPQQYSRSASFNEELGKIGSTQFAFPMKTALTDPGVYKFTGKYRGKPFASEEMIITTQAHLDLLETANFWAAEPLIYALAYGLVPEDISADFSRSTTRAEFCRMAVRTLELLTGKTAEEHIKGLGKARDISFSDTSNPDILAAAALGIISGIGGGRFAPDASIERQQVAVMLRNLCVLLGMDVTGAPPSGFSDARSIAPWAAGAVDFVRASDIMSGDGRRFMPNEAITREQAVIVLRNLFRQ